MTTGLEELRVKESDRIAVMRGGTITAVLPGNADAQAMIALAAAVYPLYAYTGRFESYNSGGAAATRAAPWAISSAWVCRTRVFS